MFIGAVQIEITIFFANHLFFDLHTRSAQYMLLPYVALSSLRNLVSVVVISGFA